MTQIFTSLGMVDEATLQYHEEVTDNDNEHTVAQVWQLDGIIVKRNVSVHIKQYPVLSSAAGEFV